MLDMVPQDARSWVMAWAIRVQTREGEPIVSPEFEDRVDAENDLGQLRRWFEDDDPLEVDWLVIARDNVISANLVGN